MQDSTRANLEGALPVGATKLTSLLALAAGAVALPQTGHADIIFTSLGPSGYSVGFSAQDTLQFTLPGTANIGFQRRIATGYTMPGSLMVNYRDVVVGNLGGGGAEGGVRANSNFLAAPLAAGATWNQGAFSMYNAQAGTANDLNINNGRNPQTGFDHQYFAWYFSDSTLGSGPATFRYGWVEVSLAVAGYNAGGPTLTIWGYGYDDTGVKPTMGQMPVPEPTSGALLALGAMALGSRGVRRWRQTRQAANLS